MKSKNKAVKRKTPDDFEINYAIECALKKDKPGMDKNVYVPPEIDGDSYQLKTPFKITNTMGESFCRKRKTPNDFETEAGKLCVSKKANFGDCKNVCMFSEANNQIGHSKVLLNSNTTHEASVPTCTNVMGKAIPFASSKSQQDDQLMPQKGTSNDVSTLIGVHSDSCTAPNVDRPTKNTVDCQRLFDHVTMQPEKSVVLGQCPVQKKVANKVSRSKNQQPRRNDQNLCIAETDVVKVFNNTNRTVISRTPPMPRIGQAHKRQCKDMDQHTSGAKSAPLSSSSARVHIPRKVYMCMSLLWCNVLGLRKDSQPIIQTTAQI